MDNLEEITKSSVEQSDSLNAGMVQNLADKDGKFLSPIDLTMDILKPIKLPKLVWQNFFLHPTKMKLTNTGHTVILSGKWSQKRPHINGGPLLTNYVFSQVHFHWGADEQEGSEHTSNGISYPMEMHVVFFKSAYLTQEAALKQDDGVIVLAYFFKLVDSGNPSLDAIVTALPAIKESRTSAHIQLVPLSFFIEEFTDDYILYWGGVQTHSCTHTILWIISRLALGVSMEQLAAFRELEDTKSLKLMRNFRDPHPLDSRSVFHANPSSNLSQLLLPVMRQTIRSSIPVMVNYNYSNVINLPKHFSKRDKLKTKRTKSKQCINNIFNTDKLIFMGSTDIEKEVERNILKILTQLKSEDKLLDFENKGENVNSELKQNEENDKNKKVKSSLGIQKMNTHEVNVRKLKEAIINLKNKDNPGNDEKVITNENEHKSVESIKDRKQIEELKIKDKFVTLYSNNNNEYKQKKNKYFKTIYRTRSTRIKIAADRKQFEKRRHEQFQNMINCKTNIYNTKKISNFNNPGKSLFGQYNTVKNVKTKEIQHAMFTEYTGKNDMHIKDDNSIGKLKKNMHKTNVIFNEPPLLQSNDDLLCKYESNQFQDIPINTPLFNTNSSNIFQSYAQNNVLGHKDKLTILKERNLENKTFKEENLTKDSKSRSPFNKNIDRLKKIRTRSASPRICYTGELQSNIDKKYKGAINEVVNYGACLPMLSINRREFSVKNKILNRVCEKRPNFKRRCDSYSSEVPRDSDSLNNEEIKRKSLLLSKYRVNNSKKLYSIGDKKGGEKENCRSISQKLNTRNRKDVTNIKTMKENTINIDKENSESIPNSTIELNTRNKEHSITNIEKTLKENTININNENSESRSNSIDLNKRNREYICENIDQKTVKENTINVVNKNSEHRTNSSIQLNIRKKKYLVTSIDKKCEENSNNKSRSPSPHKYKGSIRKRIMTNEDKNNELFKSISNSSLICNLNDVITGVENTNDQLILRYNSSERYSLIKGKEFVIKDDDIYNKALKNEHNKGRPNSDRCSLTNSTELRNNIHKTSNEISNVSLTLVKDNVNDKQKLVNNLEENPGLLKCMSDITTNFNKIESIGNIVSTYKKSRKSVPHVNNEIDVVKNAEGEEGKEWNEISNLNNLSVKCDKTNNIDLVKQERENTYKDLIQCKTQISIIFDEQGIINLVTNENKQLKEDTRVLNLKHNTQKLESVEFDMEKDQTIQENIHKESTNLVKKYSEEIDLETMIDKQIKENPTIQLLVKKTLGHLNVSGETDFDIHHTNNKTNLENTCEVNNNTKLENLGKGYDVKDKLETNVENTNREISNPDKFITNVNVETNQEGAKIESVNSTIMLTNMREYFNDVLNNTEIVTTQIKENIPESNDYTEHFNYEPTKHACIEIISENLGNQIVSNDLIDSDGRQDQLANNEVLSCNKQLDELFQQNLVTYKPDSMSLQDYTRDRSSSQNNLLRCSQPSDKFMEQFRIKKVQFRLNSPEKSNVIDGGKMLEDKFNDYKSNSLKQRSSLPYKKNYLCLSNDSINVKGLIKQKTHSKNTNKIVQIDGNTVRCRSVSPRTNYLNNDNIINNAFHNVNEDNEYYHQTSFKSSYGNSNKINNNNHVIKEYEKKECVQNIQTRSNSPEKANVVNHLVCSSGTPNNGFNMDKIALKCTSNTSSLSRSCSPETMRRLISLKNPNDSYAKKKAERSLYTNITSKRRNSIVNKFDVTSSELSSKTVSCEDKLPISSFSSPVSFDSFQYEINKRRSRLDDFANQNTDYVSSTVGYSTETDTMKAMNRPMSYRNSANSGQNPYIKNKVSTMEEKTKCEIMLENKTVSSEVETNKTENGEKFNDLEIKTNEKKNVLKQTVNKQMEDGNILNEKLKSKETFKNETRLNVLKKNLPKVKLNTLKSSIPLRNMKTKDETKGSKISNMYQNSDSPDEIKIEQNSSSSKVTSQISKEQPDRKTILKQKNKPKFPYLKRQSKTFKPDNTFIEKTTVKQREMLLDRVESNVDKTTEKNLDINKLNKNCVLKDVPINNDDNNIKKKFGYLKSRSKSSNTKSVPRKKTPPRNRSTSLNLKTPPGLKLTQEILDNKNKVVSMDLGKEHSLIQNGEDNAQIELISFKRVNTSIRKGTQPSRVFVYKSFRLPSPQNIFKLVNTSRSSTTIKQFSSNQSANCGQLTDSTCPENEQKLTAKGTKKLTNDNEQKQFQSKIPILRNRPVKAKIEL